MIQTSIWNIVHKDKNSNTLWMGPGRNSRFDEGNRLGLDVFYRGATPPSNFYIRLFNDTPTKADTLGTIASEASGNGYAAQLIGRNSVGWPTLARSIPSKETGTARAGGVSTMTLAVAANATDNFYAISTITITAGTGSGQVREITGYDGTTKIATVDKAWTVQPDATSVYIVYSDYVLTSKTVTFVASGGPIGPVTYAVLADVATGIIGNAIAFFPLTQTRTLADGDSLEFSGKVKSR